MQRYDESYSDYYDSRDPDGYPYGKAVDASSPDTPDGTPIKASFFNDIIGMMQAIQKGASPEGTSITGRPERVNESDVWNALRGFIEREVQRVLKLVPSEATEENQLADKRFVDDAVSTNSAYFVGNFNSVSELPTEGVTNNDYAYVKRTVGDITYTDRYKYNGRKAAWEFEYTLDNTSVPIATASQAGLVKGGGNVTIDADGTMNVLGFATETALTTHTNNKSNPHGVTKAQVGLSNVANTAQVTNVAWSSNKLTKTINGSTTDIVTAATLKTAIGGISIAASNYGTSSGYVKYSDGLIIQWGHGHYKNITLPISFTSTNFTIVSIINDDSSDAAWMEDYLHPTGANSAAPYSGGEVHSRHWLAIGV